MNKKFKSPEEEYVWLHNQAMQEIEEILEDTEKLNRDKHALVTRRDDRYKILQDYLHAEAYRMMFRGEIQ